MNQHIPEINAIWISNQREIVDDIKNRGYKACLAGTKECKKIQLKAGVAFHTNGLDDIGNVVYISGAYVVCLFHGVALKKVYYAAMQKTGWSYRKQCLKDFIFNWMYQDMTIAVSKVNQEVMAEAFNTGADKIRITGYPRNDVLKKINKPSDVLLNIQDPDNWKYILYMPTYRNYDEKIIRDTLFELSNDIKLKNFLREHNLKVLCKLHYLTKLDFDLDNDLFINLANEDFTTVQELYTVACMMITDYSSSVMDFSLTYKPCIIYAPDFDLYNKKVGITNQMISLYERFAVRTKNLSSEIIYGFDDDSIAQKTCKALRALMEDDSIAGTSYCQNVINDVKYHLHI